MTEKVEKVTMVLLIGWGIRDLEPDFVVVTDRDLVYDARVGAQCEMLDVLLKRDEIGATIADYDNPELNAYLNDIFADGHSKGFYCIEDSFDYCCDYDSLKQEMDERGNDYQIIKCVGKEVL